jgi:beta-glucosidase
VPRNIIPLSVVNSAAHQKLALDIADETMALLQTNPILPLGRKIRRRKLRKIAIIGPDANDPQNVMG